MHANETRFWKVATLLALLLCGWMAVRGGGTPALADNGGATTGGVIALMGVNPANEHLYLIDTNNSTIAMYENKPNTGVTLVAGRRYDQDTLLIANMPERELAYKNKDNGYSPVDVKHLIDQLDEVNRKAR
ncbi:MAG: hypothetical protein M5U26_03100 [Planctomycetota bacterium]|nr:hypothetical protein [Planctomycetota bacterium]